MPSLDNNSASLQNRFKKKKQTMKHIYVDMFKVDGCTNAFRDVCVKCFLFDWGNSSQPAISVRWYSDKADIPILVG